MRILLLSLLLLTSKSFVNAQDHIEIQNEKQASIYELRIYEIFENNKAAFHDRFRDHAIRLMKKYDFKIVSIWESKSATKTEFVYLLEWSDKIKMEKAWELFRADKEWIEIKKQTSEKHGKLVGEIQDRILSKTPYSPAN